MLKLLYVDDDDAIRELVTYCLALDSDIDVTTVGSGAEALQVIGTAHFEVVLLDVMMPEMDGPGVLAAMRERGMEQLPPVIFVTARALPEERQRLMDLGAAGVIIKPFDPISFASDVRRILAA